MDSFVPYKAELVESKPTPTWKRVASVIPSVAFSIALLCLVTGDIPEHALHDTLARMGLTWIAYTGEVIDHFIAAMSAFAKAARLAQAVQPFVFASRHVIVSTYLTAMAVAVVGILVPSVVATLRPKYSWRDIASW